MPSWNQVLEEIEAIPSHNRLDLVRRDYLAKLAAYTGRNVIAYYSGWLSHPKPNPVLSITDEDKNGFMATIHNLERTKGLDVILHTPGGDVAAAESLVDYLRKMFGTDVRAIVPQLAMSAGTMVACACKSVVMGKQSNLGPIDPQVNGLPANGVIEEFDEALSRIKQDAASLPLWQTIIGKYHPTFLGSCKMAIEWSERIVEEWLVTGMLGGEDDASAKAKVIVRGLSDQSKTYNHRRHIHLETLQDLGLKIERMEDDPQLQDLILTVHHAFMHTFSQTPALKIIENQIGAAMVKMGAPEVPPLIIGSHPAPAQPAHAM